MGREPYEDMKMDIKFQGTEYGVRKTNYPAGGRAAIVLWDKEHDEIGYVATVNLPDAPLLGNQTFIKDYSENEGMLKALQDAGIVKDTGLRVRSGFVQVPIAEFQGRFRDFVPEQQDRPEAASPGDYALTIDDTARRAQRREPDGFDRAVADLPRLWREDTRGYSVVSWEELSAERKIEYLSQHAASHDVPFDRFTEAARRTLGMEPGQEFTADDDHPLPSPRELKALAEEIRQEEFAARVRDYGEADAATYGARMAEAYRHRAEALGLAGSPARSPITDAELERLVGELERGWDEGHATRNDPSRSPDDPDSRNRAEGAGMTAGNPGDATQAEAADNKQQPAERQPSAPSNEYARTLDATARRAQQRDPDRGIDR
jgi:hypothetical protein